jgi:hypothetical protein
MLIGPLAIGVLLAAQPTTVKASAKVPADVAKEMTDAIVAVNKALGLESWESQGIKPCVDRGGEGAGTKDIGPDETRRCAGSALGSQFPSLGKSFVLAVLMASIGPVTAVAFGVGDAAGWAAYSCDPGRKCLPTKMDPGSKWGKRVLERQLKACRQPTTVWFPADARACDGVEGAVAPAPVPPSPPPPAPQPKP